MAQQMFCTQTSPWRLENHTRGLQKLLRDAEDKHFAPMTGVIVYLGIETYPTKRMRIALLERNTLKGFGYLNPPLATTGIIDINVPCNVVLVVPKRFKIFYGVCSVTAVDLYNLA